MNNIVSQQSDPGLLQKEDATIIIIDVQERLLQAVANKDAVLDNVVRLARFARIIDIPVIITEQQNLGPTVSQVKDELPELSPITKLEFNAFTNDEFAHQLDALGRKTLLIAGLETHICISQTALAATPRFIVHIASDAVSSRSVDNWRIALERMRQNDIIISSTEMIIYELLERAGTDEFKAALKLVK